MENSQPDPAVSGVVVSTSRVPRLAVVAGVCRTCVIDSVLEHSPAEYARRPNVPAESPTLGLTHLQFEALLSTAKHSSNRCDFALVTMLGLLGLRIFEATAATSRTSVRNTGTECCGYAAKATRSFSSRSPSRGPRPRHARSTCGAPARSCSHRGTRMDRHCATRRLRRLAEEPGVKLPRMHPHMLRHTFLTTMLDAGADLRDVQIAARHADPRTTMRCDRARKNLDRHPDYILAYMASGT